MTDIPVAMHAPTLGTTPSYSGTSEKGNKDASWPEMDDDAYYGLAGEITNTIKPHTEADPAGLLTQLLVAFGSAVGRGPHFMVEGDIHATNLFIILVGETSKGRKGTSWGRVRQVYELTDDSWVKERVMSGLSSGEGLIWAVRDPIFRREKVGKGDDAHYEDIEVDVGVDDKRLLVIEPEFASTLRVMARDGNTLSPLIRQAWDRGDLRTMTKNSPAKATGALVSIIGHVTADELRRYLDRTETGNGFANRFLYICVRRSKCLPDGGQLSHHKLTPYAQRVTKALEFARSVDCLCKDTEARTIWQRVYPELSEGLPGLFGAVTSRAEAQVMRLAMLYALLDQSPHINAHHLKAALAVWEYAEASARYVFGTAVGDPVADDILRALRANRDRGGLTRTEISGLFKRHKDAQAIGRALDLLQREKLADVRQDKKTVGRPVEVWFAT